MNDPPRLRDLPDDPFTSALLRSAAPTQAFTAADAARLQVRVAHAGAASGALSAGVAAKVLATVLVVAAGAVGWRASHSARTSPVQIAVVVRTPVAPHVAPSVPSMAVAPTTEPAEPMVEATPAATPSTPPPERRRAPSTSVAIARHAQPSEPVAVAAPEASLADELRVIEAARGAVRLDPARAASTLLEADRTRPHGQLRDERDALLVEALTRCGRWDEARARARALEARAPQSPQGSRVRALLRDAP